MWAWLRSYTRRGVGEWGVVVGREVGSFLTPGSPSKQ